MKTIDTEKIYKTKIPDLHFVYGGVRGRTMSSRSQRYAWPSIAESGIDTVIELRDDDSSSRMINLCKEFSMEYYHFPVDKSLEPIKIMVDQFPEFCQKIVRGGFYIACAMGLHRTDIALSLFWVFYGADNGFDPPQLWGYVKRDGHDTSKIHRVLNAFYNEWTQKYGAEPMDKDEFARRKGVINMQSEMSLPESMALQPQFRPSLAEGISELKYASECVNRLCPAPIWDSCFFEKMVTSDQKNEVTLIFRLARWSAPKHGVSKEYAQAKAQGMMKSFLEYYGQVSNKNDLSVKGDWMIYLAVGTVIRKAKQKESAIKVVLLKPDGTPVSEHEIVFTSGDF